MPGIGVNPDYDYLLDPQQAKAYGICERCGRREIYAPGESLCYWCREVSYGDEE